MNIAEIHAENIRLAAGKTENGKGKTENGKVKRNSANAESSKTENVSEG